MRRALRWVMVCFWLASAALAQAAEAEQELQAIFLGRFASYVQWAHQGRPAFVIAVIGNPQLGAQLARTYADKRIQGKPVHIRTVSGVPDIGAPDMLFIDLPTVAARQAAIAHAQGNGILSVSDARGFAEMGGVIQIDFVEQSARIKINYDAAIRSGLRIGAPLLSIATVLRESQP